MSSAPRERPIICGAESARAILAGTKTQTRRVLKLPQFGRSGTRGYDWTWRGQAPIRSVAQQRRYPRGCWQDVSTADLLAICPHGMPGDCLWVREAWRGWFPIGRDGQPDGAGNWLVRYAADDSIRHTNCGWDEGPCYTRPADVGLDREPAKWRSPVFMPRWASRLLLEITAVRVQRLQDISEEDVAAEGVANRVSDSELAVLKQAARAAHLGVKRIDAVALFAGGWDRINAHRPGCSWADNPWVRAITFERCPANG